MTEENENKSESNPYYPKEIIDKLFFSMDESEIIVIKAHLFIEYQLDKFLTAFSKTTVDIEKMNFTFNHKLNISRIIGLFENNEELENYVVNLNKLRNQIAHKHTYDIELYDKIIGFPDLFKNQTKWKSKDDFKIGMMAIKSSWMVGMIQGKLDRLKSQ